MTNLTTVIETGLNEEKSRDEIIIELVTKHDLTISKATKEFAGYLKDNGLSMNTSCKADALEYITEHMSGQEIETGDIKPLVVELMDQFKVADSTARDYIKAWCEQEGQTYPVANPRQAMFDFLVANAGTVTKEEFKEFGKSLGRSDSNINEYWKGYELHLAIVAAQS